jgi:uncharacterized GH25 family protein
MAGRYAGAVIVMRLMRKPNLNTTRKEKENTMRKTVFGVFVFLIFMWVALPAMGHGLWVNAHKNDVHPPGHVLTTIGFGHLTPLDDLLTTEYGTLDLESYLLIDPKNEKTDLPKPRLDGSTIHTAAGVDVLSGDLGACKMTLNSDSRQGTYQVTAKTKEVFFSMWFDQKGRMRMKPIPMDQIDKPKKILKSMQYKTNAKACFAVGDWSVPPRQGDALEIIPTSDLSNVKVGDEVEFEVVFMDKPLSASPEGLFHMTGISRSFGASDRTFLMSYLQEGRCRFRMPAAGQWLMQVKAERVVADVPELAALKSKCQTVNYTSSFTFHVHP